MSPVERAARALCALDGRPENIRMDAKPLWQDYLPEAHAVISASRKPSAEQLQAASDCASNDPAAIYAAMIDALQRTEEFS